MGLLDTILGRTKPVRPDLDALFALPSAAVTLETTAGYVLSSQAGVCWKPPAGRSVEEVQQEISELLQMDDDPQPSAPRSSAPGSTPTPSTSVSITPSAPGPGILSQEVDPYGYRWLVLEDEDTEQLVTRVHLVNSLLTENGWGPQLLCSVFGVRPAPDASSGASPFFLVYLYKRGTFYPFAPVGRERRDNELELRIRGMLGSDLPLEQDISRWFPLWDLPVH